MTDYRTRAIKFLHQIFPFICDAHTPGEVLNAVVNYNEKYHRAVMVAHGATRIALITSDYVIKFDYGDDVECYGGCDMEARFYEYACEEGFGEYFVQTTLCPLFGHKFYIMPRVKEIGKVWLCDCVPGVVYDWIIDHVYDLHMGNIGFMNGHGVILDYAMNSLYDYDEPAY